MLQDSMDCLVTLQLPEDFSQFQKDIDPEWIEEALCATGTASIRKRRLPATQVVWLVIGMALFRNRPINELVNKLDLAMPDPRHRTIARSGIVKARTRLGEEPMARLFIRCADEWAHASADRDRWRGLALYGIDGTTLKIPDSEENREFFGGSKGGRGESGYPLVRLVGLMALRSHLLANVSFGPYTNSEHNYTADLWSSVPDNSLSILDRLFLAANVLIPLNSEGENRHWLTRAKSNTKAQRIKRLGTKDELAEMNVSGYSRKKVPTLPKTWTVRIIRYQRKGFRPERLITSLLDPEAYPRKEIVALYHERWEIEIGYDETKTKMLGNSRVPLRSKSMARVCQEIWGLLIAYNLIRLEMERVADEANVKPTRISFVAVYRMICDEWLWCSLAAPGAIPRHLRELRQEIALFILPERRPERRYPRAVKIKMSNYARKRKPFNEKQPK